MITNNCNSNANVKLVSIRQSKVEGCLQYFNRIFSSTIYGYIYIFYLLNYDAQS